MLLRKEIKEVIESSENSGNWNIIREMERLEAFPCCHVCLECSGGDSLEYGVE